MVFRLLLDWLQVFLLVVQPGRFSIPSDYLLWRAFNWISLRQFMNIQGFSFYEAWFYLFVASMGLWALMFVWASWSCLHKTLELDWCVYKCGLVRVWGICICLDTSAGPEPNHRAYQCLAA